MDMEGAVRCMDHTPLVSALLCWIHIYVCCAALDAFHLMRCLAS